MLYIFLIIISVVVLFWILRRHVEGFNESSGQFCRTCEGKTLNQCTSCFNCGLCVDSNGNSSCIGGDYKGPYNYEKCARWYSGDGFTYMMQQNDKYSKSMGPRSPNRPIGI
jgi:hypothetical protein